MGLERETSSHLLLIAQPVENVSSGGFTSVRDNYQGEEGTIIMERECPFRTCSCGIFIGEPESDSPEHALGGSP